MEIKIKETTASSYAVLARIVKKAPIHMESVVPDVNDDIGRIFSVQPSVLLKSKEVTSRGVSVTGEVSVVLFYVNETENAVSNLTLAQSFSLDYEAADLDPETLAQIRLFIGSTEARALNPRKVSAAVEIGGELTGYCKEEIRVSIAAPAEDELPIQTRSDSAECTLVNAVCEKTFVLNEHFPFPLSKPQPEHLAAHKVDLRIADKQLIGSKVLLKGSLCVEAYYLTSSAGYPVLESFSAPFSQLMDIAEEQMDNCTVIIEATSCYFDLADTIGGEKVLNAEIHAVAQLVSRKQQTLQYLSDAYCITMPCSIDYAPWHIQSAQTPIRLTLEVEDRLDLPEDCTDVLAVFPCLSQSSVGPDKAESSVILDVLYRSAGGTLSSLRRTLRAEKAMSEPDASLIEARILDSYFRPETNQMSCHISVELCCDICREYEIRSAEALSLEEDAPYDLSALPTVTAVRADSESVWELAKTYHSSVRRIEEFNDIEGALQGQLLLIPRGL